MFYAGMRGATARIVDALPQAGGQLTALYPEKYIFDVAGHPKILAKDLSNHLPPRPASSGIPRTSTNGSTPSNMTAACSPWSRTPIASRHARW